MQDHTIEDDDFYLYEPELDRSYTDLWDAVERHVQENVLPQRASEGLFLLGYKVLPVTLYSPLHLLPPIVTVGLHYLGERPVALVEDRLAMFAHRLAEPFVFRVDVFDAAMAMASDLAPGTLDLTPIAQEFDRLMIRRGCRPTGISSDPKGPDFSWTPWKEFQGQSLIVA